MAPIRVATSSDVDAVAGLIGEFRDWWGYHSPSDEGLRGSVERLVTDPSTEFLLAGEVGVAQLRYRYGLWHEADDCWLEDLFVREEARRQGVGRELAIAAVERARARG